LPAPKPKLQLKTKSPQSGGRKKEENVTLLAGTTKTEERGALAKTRGKNLHILDTGGRKSASTLGDRGGRQAAQDFAGVKGKMFLGGQAT